MINGKIHYKWSFSIAMLNYQRVIKVLQAAGVKMSKVWSEIQWPKNTKKHTAAESPSHVSFSPLAIKNRKKKQDKSIVELHFFEKKLGISSHVRSHHNLSGLPRFNATSFWVASRLHDPHILAQPAAM